MKQYNQIAVVTIDNGEIEGVEQFQEIKILHNGIKKLSNFVTKLTEGKKVHSISSCINEETVVTRCLNTAKVLCHYSIQARILNNHTLTCDSSVEWGYVIGVSEELPNIAEAIGMINEVYPNHDVLEIVVSSIDGYINHNILES